MPTLNNKNHPDVYFEASEMEATFADGSHISFGDEDLLATKSPAGDDVIVLKPQNDDDDDDDHIIRLYLTSPEMDWRRNVTYSWQLSMAWMRVPHIPHDDNETGWLCWNRENNVNSQTLSYTSNSLFVSDMITLLFKPMNRFPRHTSKEKKPTTKLVLKNVLMGAQLPINAAKSLPTQRYRPCDTTADVCNIVDGLVTTAPFSESLTTTKSTQMMMYLSAMAVVAPILVALVVMIVRCVKRRNIQQQKYDPITTNDGDEVVAKGNHNNIKEDGNDDDDDNDDDVAFEDEK